MQREKEQYFQYVIHKLLIWNKELKGSEDNDFSVLKLMKLLFFVSAASTTKDISPNGDDLLNVFDNFHALPLGPVESDIYNILRTKKGLLDHYKISYKNTEKVDNINNTFYLTPDNYTNTIDKSIEYLKTQNFSLLRLTPYDLVNLSHLWYSWNEAKNRASKLGLGSAKINESIVRNEYKIYYTSILSV